MEILTQVEWGTMIYSLSLFGLFIGGMILLSNFLIKKYSSIRQRTDQYEDLSAKLDRIIELSEENSGKNSKKNHE